MRLHDLLLITERASLRDLLSSDRHWYHPESGTLRTLPFGGNNHSQDVFENPDVYGIDRSELPEKQKYDYDEALLWAAMKHGWVRIFVDRRDPDHNSNIEGAKWRHIRATLEMFATALRKLPEILIVQRTGPNDSEGDAYRLDTNQIEDTIRKGRPPGNTVIRRAPTGTPSAQNVQTPLFPDKLADVGQAAE